MTALLRLEEVGKSYARGDRRLSVLRDVTLDVQAGQLVGVCGSRGSGKSTLLRVAAGQVRPDTGRLLVGGVDAATLSRAERAALPRRLAVAVREAPLVASVTMRDYVSLAVLGLRRKQRRERAAEALERAGVGDVADRRWCELSDTERLACAIAHALARDPEVLIVDDPTVAISLLDRDRIARLLRSAAEDDGRGVLVASPDLGGLIGHLHEVRMLSRGRLRAPAEHEPPSGGTVVEFPGGARAS